MKIIVFLSLFSLSLTFCVSQSFMHGAGVGTFVADVPDAGACAGFAFTYSPRVNFVETEALSVSLGIPVSIGFTLSKTHDTFISFGSSYSYTPHFMLNVPAIINLNVGAGSTKENRKRFGFFVGGGFAYHYGGYSQEDKDYYYDNFVFNTTRYIEKYSSSFGPSANAGLRFAVGSHRKNIEARLSYMKAISRSINAVYGAAALFNF